MSKKSARQFPDVVVNAKNEKGTEEFSIQKWTDLHKDGSFDALVSEHMYLHNRYFIKETDRATAVLTPAYLDELITKLLQQKLAPGKSTDSLLSTERGALAAFSAKIDLAHSLGLIDSITWGDLHIIRRIRNDFAHQVDIHDFSYDSVLNRCNELYVYKQQKLTSSAQARQAFLASVLRASWEIAKPLANGT